MDDVLPEPLGGAHKDYDATALTLKQALLKNLDQLLDIKQSELLDERYKKFRKMGVFTKGEPKKRGSHAKKTAAASA